MLFSHFAAGVDDMDSTTVPPASLQEAWEAALANDSPHYREALHKSVQFALL